MEDGNQLLKNNGLETIMKFGDAGGEQLKGLYLDLLSCIGAGDHPELPHGYKPKPMTGFLNIVEAFSSYTKLHAAGSGIVFEVGSKELVGEEEIFTSGSGETWGAKKSGESSTNSESLQSFLCDDDSFRQTSATSTQSAEITTSSNDLGGAKLSSNSVSFASPESGSVDQPECFQKEEEETQNDANKQTCLDENENERVDTYDDAREILENRDKASDDVEYINVLALSSYNTHEFANESYSHSDIFNANPLYINEVGPTLKLPDSLLLTSVHRDSSQNKSQQLKYYEELKEIEKMLQEYLVTPLEACPEPPSIVLPGGILENPTENVTNEGMLPGGMTQTFADGLISPSCALEMMYDMESCESPQSPRGSTYESCTSFATWQTQGLPNVSSKQNVDLLERRPSFYMECLNVNANGSSDITQHSSSLDSINPLSFSRKVTLMPRKENSETNSRIRECINYEQCDNYLLSEMVNKFTTSTTDSRKNINEFSEDFVDAEQESINDVEKGKFAQSKSPVSSEDEHVWTSASGSEDENYEDVCADVDAKK